jgi:hypothetical protein
MSRITRRAKELRNRGARGILRWRPDLPSLSPRLTLGVPATIKVLVGLLLVLVIVVGAEGYLSRMRRTAEATVRIESIDSHAGPGMGATGGYVIGYAFEASGRTFRYVARRSWSFETVNAAKVCYEPANPRNQSLTKADEPCR